METVTINNKGQITIPVKIRKKLGLKKGTRLRIFATQNSNELTVMKEGSIMDLADNLPKPDKTFTIEEINEAMEKAVCEEALK